MKIPPKENNTMSLLHEIQASAMQEGNIDIGEYIEAAAEGTILTANQLPIKFTPEALYWCKWPHTEAETWVARQTVPIVSCGQLIFEEARGTRTPAPATGTRVTTMPTHTTASGDHSHVIRGSLHAASCSDLKRATSG